MPAGIWPGKASHLSITGMPFPSFLSERYFQLIALRTLKNEQMKFDPNPASTFDWLTGDEARFAHTSQWLALGGHF
jgi:hypothetical protein